MTTRNDWELLSKADVIREYCYPATLLDADISSGAVAAFFVDGSPAQGVKCNFARQRFYIPRLAIERRIAAVAGMEGQG